MWHGEFPASYIEEITQKTGSAKKYGVFLKMLVSGLRKEADSVHADVFTPYDLELLRSRKNPAVLNGSMYSASSMA